MSSIPTQNGSALSVNRGMGGAGDSAGVFRMLGAMAWGLSLGVVGMWILVGSGLPGFLDRLSAAERVGVGIGMLCGGQLIFLMLVARRLFPRVPHRLASTANWGLLLVGIACLIFVVVARVYGGGA